MRAVGMWFMKQDPQQKHRVPPLNGTTITQQLQDLMVASIQIRLDD